MGLLNKLVEIEEILHEEQAEALNRYDLKLQIIQNRIYGADQEPIAMLICKLRFFIALLCDQDKVDFENPEENFEIRPLPNLETKFVIADSLTDADIRKYTQQGEVWLNGPTLQKKYEELHQIRRNHFMANTPSKKKGCQKKDKAKRQEIIKEIEKTRNNRARQKTLEFLRQQINKQSQELEKYPKQPLESKDYANKREQIRKRISRLRKELAELQKEDGFKQAVEQLTFWNPYNQTAVSPFFDPEWMFGSSNSEQGSSQDKPTPQGYFDIIIGNPPYIQLQKNGGKLAQRYKDHGYQSFASTGDIYCLFYERGWQLLKPGGHLCYISSNKWMRSDYGEKLRAFLSQNTQPKLLIDFAGRKIFESATVDTNILLLEKPQNPAQPKQQPCKCVEMKREEPELWQFVKQNQVPCLFDKHNWVILSPIAQSIKHKIEAVGTPLKNWDIQINYGIKTGCNAAFIISTAQRAEILADCETQEERQRTAELLRPILRGRDIKRYGYENSGLFLINTHNGIKGKIPRINVDEYPAIKAHLDQYLDRIKPRSDQGDTPYNLRNCAFWQDFEKPKIVYPNMTKYLSFCYDDQGFLINQKCFMITGKNIGYLTAFLNSSLFKFCFKDDFPRLQDEGRELSKVFFEKIPVLPVSPDMEKVFAAKVQDIQAAYSREKALEIDKMIFDHYKLSQTDREAIGFIEIE